ncbi:uncharacterized protein LOC131073245 isoform X2 [Cryptomeria japonica]|uniref:uncharacterized protein LOC131073245 isoform X2 n=1 Tax=Cryptomeria japonica TaxID=3369 RepID=UPI0025AD858D|nr:uncharacterized protein LOC131073245 isoform X2 [Cryptomeria japonica]
MERKLSKRALTLKPSPIQELSHLAQRCNAINLAEGFPDFPAPMELKEAAIGAISADFNQYRHVQGVCDYIAWTMKLNQGLDVDPVKNITICCGQSEAFAATILSVVDQGDEVLLFDPAYETYEACITMAGGTPVYVALNPPHWTLNVEELMAAFTSQTKAIVLNRKTILMVCVDLLPLKLKKLQVIHCFGRAFKSSPHNPTGKVFSKNELMIIAELCCRMDCLAITDEVYEHITFDSEHISLASLPGMLDRTIITSSMSKTYSVTGWRVGWAVAPFEIASSIRNIHVKLTDSAPAPFQEAALVALKSGPEYLKKLRMEYKERRDFIVDSLGEVGFKVHFKPQGAVFVFAELPETCVEYVAELIKVAGVAAVPGCGFFHDKGKFKKEDCSQSAIGSIQRPESVETSEILHTAKNYRNRYIRFAYCKSKCTLLAAADKLSKYKDKLGGVT